MNNDRIFLCRPTHRNTDPVTSQLSDIENETSGLRARQMKEVVEALEGYSEVTSYELAALSKIDRYTVARRLSDARECNLVVNGDKRKCKITGRMALTWNVK